MAANLVWVTERGILARIQREVCARSDDGPVERTVSLPSNVVAFIVHCKVVVAVVVVLVVSIGRH